MSRKQDNNNLICKAQSGDNSALEKLVKDNINLVYKLANRYKNTFSDYDDIVSFGTIGLISAIKQFNVSYDTEFSTYAVPLILGEIKRYFRDDGALRVSRSLKELYINIEKIKRKYEEDNNYESPSIEFISNELNVSKEDIIMALESHNYPTSLESPIDEDCVLYDVVGEEENERIIDNLDLEKAIMSLNKKEQLFIKLRFFDEMKQAEIAKRLFVSQVQVSRMEKKIIEKLKQLMS